MSEARSTDDHYVTLGVAPRCEAVVIRVAYIALMRLHHPDKNSSPASSERAQAITTAFAVLGDVEKRQQYDWARRRAAEESELPPSFRLTRVHYGLIAASVVALVAMPLAFMQVPQRIADPVVRSPTERAARAVPQSLPARPKTIQIASAPAVKVPNPAPTRDPPAAIAEQALVKQPKLENPSRVATLAPRAPLTPLESPRAVTTTKVVKQAAVANTKCASARPGADTVVCNNNNLAALDQLAETFHGQSLKAGNVFKRAVLLDARKDFLGRREACHSETCLRTAYQRHMRDIAKIMEGKQPN